MIINHSEDKYGLYSEDVKTLLNGCDYLILQSQRKVGKSYAVKKYVLEYCYKNKKEFFYVRRHKTEVKDIDVVDYFANMDISQITKGEYTLVNVYRKRIYFANVDEKGRIINSQRIGYVKDLATSSQLKSLEFPTVEFIIVEEFTTDELYLADEPRKLEHLISTVARDRQIKVILIGNLITPFNPYYESWDLSAIDLTPLNNTIDFHYDKVVIRAINLSRNMEDTFSMSFGLAKESIDKFGYEVKEQPKIDVPLEDCKVIYKFFIKVQSVKLECQCLNYNNRIFIYVKPKTTRLLENDRIITDCFSSNLFTTHGFKPLTQQEDFIFNLIKNDKVCFLNNLTGTFFKQALKNL